MAINDYQMVTSHLELQRNARGAQELKPVSLVLSSERCPASGIDLHPMPRMPSDYDANLKESVATL